MENHPFIAGKINYKWGMFNSFLYVYQDGYLIEFSSSHQTLEHPPVELDAFPSERNHE